MNCRDLDLLTESRSFGSLTEAERHDGEAHANSCHHCAPLWVAYARLPVVRVPPMPAELATRCRALAAARAQGSVLRFAPRGVMFAVGGFVVLAAAAGVLTAHLMKTPAPQRADAAIPPQVVTPVEVAQPPPPPPPPVPQNTDHVKNGEPAMNKSKSITVAVALGAAAVAQAETAPPAAAEPHIKSAEEIVATNDLNKDGIVTLDEATKVNGHLLVMWSVYDLDHDNRLDIPELKRALTAVDVGTAVDKITGNTGGNMAAARPEAIMANNDLNKDGVVTKEEAKTAGKALYRMWDSYDLNKDGKVDLAELARMQGY